MKNILLPNDFELSKNSFSQVRDEIASRVIEGELDPIKAYADFKFYDKVFTGDDKKNNGLSHIIKPYVIADIEKDKAKTEYYGFKVGISEAGARWNFENCNFPQLEDLYEQQKELKEKISKAETFLKGIPKGGHLFITDENKGEQVKVFAPVKVSTTSPIFTLK